MQTIYKTILVKFFKASLIPVIVIELSLVATLFWMNANQTQHSRKTLESLSAQSFSEIATHTADQISQQFSQAKHEIMQLQTLASEIFSNPERYQNMQLTLIKENGFFKDQLPNRLSYIYTTNKNHLTTEDRKTMEHLSLLITHVQQVVSSNKELIQSAWINIGKYYSLFYPALDVSNELEPNLDVTQQRFYYEADPIHNPKKSIKFLDLYGESWATTLGQMGAYLAPIYAKKRFIGVIGVNVTVNKTAQIFKHIDLPFNAYAMLVDKHDQLLVSSDENRSFKDLHAHSFYDAHLKAVEMASSLQMIDRKRFNKEDKVIFEHPIKNTHLKVLFCADKEDIYGTIERLSKKNKRIGLYIIIGIALFYLIFFLLMLRSVRALAQKIAMPLKNIVTFSAHLGETTQVKLPSSHISELETLNNNLSNTQARLIELVNIDQTTALLNHQRLRKDSLKKGEVLILFKLLNYEDYNNLFGPKVGNAALIKLIEVIRASQSFQAELMHLYRDSKDTIAILMPHSAIEALHQNLDTMLEGIAAESFRFEGVEVDLSVHAGLSMGEIDDDLDLLAQAYIALSQAKATQVCTIYEEIHGITKQYQENLIWGRELKNALADNRIVGFFQPIFDYKKMRVCKSESLVRMQLNGEIITPYRFLYAAEQVGKMHQITLVMLNEVFRMAERYPDFEFSVNTSFEDFEENKLLQTVKEKLKKSTIKPQNIIFEILETQTFNDQNRIVQMLKELKSLGFKIAIDDFGTGHSNFAHLMMLEVDYIKIDGMFVKDIDHDQMSQKMVKTIVSFAKQIGAKTIAEYVHSEAVFEKIQTMGVDFAQGYYISEPLSREDFESFIGT